MKKEISEYVLDVEQRWYGDAGHDEQFTNKVIEEIKDLVKLFADDLKNNNLSRIFNAPADTAIEQNAQQVLMYYYMDNYPNLFYDWLDKIEEVSPSQFLTFSFTQEVLTMSNLSLISSFGFSETNIFSLYAPKLKVIAETAFKDSEIRELCASEKCLGYENLPNNASVYLGSYKEKVR